MISRCPQCGREVAIPPGVVAEAVVRCPICSAEYPLADALSQLPPLLIVVDPVLAVAGSEEASDVTSVQSAPTADEVALLARQPIADAAEGEGADLFAAAEETGDESAETAVGEAAESADDDVFESAVAADEAVADEQAEGAVEDEAVAEEEFGIAGEEDVEEDADAEGAAALADFARLQEAKAEPSTAAKLRRKKGKNPVWQLGGVIGGAVVGLFLGYYVLNFFWGPQHDYFGVWLPGCPHTAKHRPTWLGGEASAEPNGSSEAGGKRNSAAKSATERRQRADQQNGKPSGKPTDAAPSADRPTDESPAAGGTDSTATKPSDPPQALPSIDEPAPPAAGEPKPDLPSLDVPSLDLPKLDPPKLDQPSLDGPSSDAPSPDLPKIDRPTLDVPSLDPPKLDAPKLDDLMPNAPAVDRPMIDEPKLDMPKPDPAKPDPFAPVEPKTVDKPGREPSMAGDDLPAAPGEQPGEGESASMPRDSQADGKPNDEQPIEERPAAPTKESPLLPEPPSLAEPKPPKMEPPLAGEPAVAQPELRGTTTPDPTGAPHKPAAPDSATVGWKNPPHSSTAELQTSLSEAWKVFGCNRCDATGVVRIEGQEQPCPACQGKPSAEITSDVYEKMAAAAARAVHVDGDDLAALDAARAEADRFFAQVGRLGVAEQLGRRAAEQLQSADGPRGGVVLACVMGREFSKEGLFGATVETLGQPHRIGVFSNRSLGVEPGKKVILLGDVMVNPSENLAGATLTKPWIIWVGRVIEIDEPN